MPRKKMEHTDSLFPVFNPLRVKYKDIFDIKAFYESFHEYLLEHGWEDADQIGKNFDHWESYYGERVSSGGAKEVWWRWRMAKKVEGGPFTYYLDMNTHVLGLVKTEVVRDGQKLKVNKGEIDMQFKAFIRRDFMDDFEKSSILKHFTTMFNKRVFIKQISRRKKDLYHEIYAMQNFLKQWFKLKRYMPYEESEGFFKSYAYPSHLKE